MEASEEETAVLSSLVCSEDIKYQDKLVKMLGAVQLDIAQLTEKMKDQTPVRAQDCDSLTKIYQAKERRLKYEIALCKSNVPIVSPKNPAYLDNLVKSDMAATIAQLKETLTYLKATKKELQVEKERLKECLRIDCQIKEALHEKIQKTIDEPLQKEKYFEETKAKNENAIRQLKDLMKKMGDFLKEYYPSPPPSKASKKNPNPIKFVSLKNIMEVLMNRCMDHPNDPWVEIEETYWPVYIELLLRFGIALRHPENVNFIKLTPFHL